jgi:hypothetical protein
MRRLLSPPQPVFTFPSKDKKVKTQKLKIPDKAEAQVAAPVARREPEANR